MPDHPALSEQLTAVLVTFRSEEIIAQALDSLLNVHGLTQVIVVDNASNDRTVAQVQTRFPQVQVIANSRNVGFGVGNNQGLQQVQTPYALVLNPDVLIPAAGLQTLVDVAERHPRAAMIGPWPSDEQGIAPQVRIGGPDEDLWTSYLPDCDFQTAFLVGAALLMRMEQMRSIGFFDPDIFLYYEDDELSYRVKQAGSDMVVTTRTVMNHQHGRSSTPSAEVEAFKLRHFAWSKLYFEQKRHGQAAAQQAARNMLQSAQRKQQMLRLLPWSACVKYNARMAAAQDFLAGCQPPSQPEPSRQRRTA